jgi:hypothetical protein
LERLEEENIRLLLSFKGIHEQLQAQVVDQEDILQHFEREMSSRDLQIQGLMADIKAQQTIASDAVARSQQQISRVTDDCAKLLAEKESKIAELEARLLSSESLRDRVASLELQLRESEGLLAEERLFCRREIVRIAADHESKLFAMRQSYEAKTGGLDSQLEQRANDRAQQIVSDVFSRTKHVVAEVAFLHQQLHASNSKLNQMTEKNKSLQLQLEVSDCRCKELMLEGQSMQRLIDQQGKQIECFSDDLKKLSAASDSSPQMTQIIQQLRAEVAQKDAYITKLYAKFGKDAPAAAASASLSSASRQQAAHHHSPSSRSEPRAFEEERSAQEQLYFLTKVFESDLGIADELSSHLKAAAGICSAGNASGLRPSPTAAMDQLQAMLAVESTIPPPNVPHQDATSCSRPYLSRPQFLSRRLRVSSPPTAQDEAKEVRQAALT